MGWLDLDRRAVGRPEGELRLTAREAALLRHLSDRPGRTVGADALLVEVWGYRPGVASRTVEVTVSAVRRKIERDPARPDHLLTVRGEGYRFVPLAEPDDDAALDPEARRRAIALRAERAGYDDPAAALALLDGLPEDAEVAERRAEHLAALGRLDEAAATVARGGRLGADAARVALLEGTIGVRRRDPTAEERLRAATTGSDGVAIRARVRLGVLMLDAGRLDGWDELRRAAEDAVSAGAARLEATALAEQGLYAVLRGTPEEAAALLETAVARALRARATYTERVARFGLALALRLRGDAAADRELRRAELLPVPRWEEPGVFALRALDARLAGRDAGELVAAGLRRDADRPYPADRAMLLGLAGAPEAREALLADGPAYVAALCGHRAPLADQRLHAALARAWVSASAVRRRPPS